jgi:hypothetical protein
VCNEEKIDNLLIITHRDLDGVISAFLLLFKLRSEYKNIDVVFSQPYLSSLLKRHLVSKVKLASYKHVALLDLSVDYMNPNSTKSLVAFLLPKLKFLVDHHTGWIKLLSGLNTSSFNLKIDGEYHLFKNDNEKCIILGDEPCCAKLIYDHFHLESLQDEYIEDMLRISIISDDLLIRKDLEHSPIYESFTNLKNKTIENCLREIISAKHVSEFQKGKIDWYEKNTKDATQYLKLVKEIAPGIGYIWSFPEIDINYTSLCEQAYKQFKVLIIKELDAKNMKISFTIAHTIPNLDLTKLFKLRGGSPRRVTVYKRGMVVEDLVKKLSPFIT